MNGRTSRSRKNEPCCDVHSDRAKAGSDRRQAHDPVPREIDVDGAPMAVDRCRNCGTVVLDPGRPGGPCPGRNHTLTGFGVVPPTDRERERDPSGGYPALADNRGTVSRPPGTDRDEETDRCGTRNSRANADREGESETDREGRTGPLLTSR